MWQRIELLLECPFFTATTYRQAAIDSSKFSDRISAASACQRKWVGCIINVQKEIGGVQMSNEKMEANGKAYWNYTWVIANNRKSRLTKLLGHDFWNKEFFPRPVGQHSTIGPISWNGDGKWCVSVENKANRVNGRGLIGQNWPVHFDCVNRHNRFVNRNSANANTSICAHCAADIHMLAECWKAPRQSSDIINYCVAVL